MTKVQKANKAQFISFSPSAQRLDANMSQMSSMKRLDSVANLGGSSQRMQPPLLIVSASEDPSDFKGVSTTGSAKSIIDMRMDYS